MKKLLLITSLLSIISVGAFAGCKEDSLRMSSLTDLAIDNGKMALGLYFEAQDESGTRALNIIEEANLLLEEAFDASEEVGTLSYYTSFNCERQIYKMRAERFQKNVDRNLEKLISTQERLEDLREEIQ